MKEIYTALAKAQGELTNIELNSSVTVKTNQGSSYKFEYATLGQIMNAIRPILSKHELATYQSIEDNCMVTRILHSSGQELLAKCPMPTLPEEPQKRGSVITYFRRYSLVTALGLVAEDDDDANVAEGNHVERTTKPVSEFFVASTGGVRYKGEWFNGQAADLLRKAKEEGKDLDKVVEYIKQQSNQ